MHAVRDDDSGPAPRACEAPLLVEQGLFIPARRGAGYRDGATALWLASETAIATRKASGAITSVG